MLKIYGNMQCPDCVRCRKELDAAKVEFMERTVVANRFVRQK